MNSKKGQIIAEALSRAFRASNTENCFFWDTEKKALKFNLTTNIGGYAEFTLKAKDIKKALQEANKENDNRSKAIKAGLDAL